MQNMTFKIEVITFSENTGVGGITQMVGGVRYVNRVWKAYQVLDEIGPDTLVACFAGYSQIPRACTGSVSQSPRPSIRCYSALEESKVHVPR